MDIQAIYKAADAYLEGHFVLSSGKHSKYYLQSAKVLEDPKTAQKLADALADKIQLATLKIDTICSPALGGLIAGYELARSLGVRFIFTERSGTSNAMTLKRGFTIKNGEKILIVEDIITTAKSALEAANCVKNLGANVVGFAALANRGFCTLMQEDKPHHKFCHLEKHFKVFALANFQFELFDASNCPLCQAGSTAIKPGSRKL